MPFFFEPLPNEAQDLPIVLDHENPHGVPGSSYLAAGPSAPGAETIVYRIINPDRTLIATWGSITARGTAAVSGGQATYQMAPPIQEGTLKLYMDGGMDGAFYGTLAPES
jgi:hypothetical protein